MPGDARPWKPKDWEDHIQRLLKKRYAKPTGSYQHIAPETHGDCGLEGFAHDGTAYQCYSAQDWTTSAQLLTKQKNKLTKDIGKFISKEAELLTILGDIKIAIWNFVLPYWNNKDLLKHAREKQTEVRERKLRHATQDFRISVITGEEFEVEERQLANLDMYQFDVPAPATAPASITSWMEGKKNLKLVANLSRKATIIGSGKSDTQRNKFLNRMVENYIGGIIVLGKLQRELPEVYEKVIERKLDREDDLEMESYSTTLVPAEFFASTLKQYKTDLTSVAGISPRVANVLAREAVSDWLLRCPMEFE
jgi:hypothetical protein